MPSDAFKSWWTKFRATGDISPVRLGCSREELRAVFGEPDDVGGTSRKHKTPVVWKYGELEFHFGPKSTDALELIYSETEQGIADISIPRTIREYVVDVSAATSWPEFIEAFNRDFIGPVGNADWDGNLDAFNDFLWWPSEHPYRLVVQGWHMCLPAVNQHRSPDGRPILDEIAEIFQDNEQVEVDLT